MKGTLVFIISVAIIFLMVATTGCTTQISQTLTNITSTISGVFSFVTTQPIAQVTPTQSERSRYQEACGEMYYCWYGNHVFDGVTPVKNDCYEYSSEHRRLSSVSGEQIKRDPCSTYLEIRASKAREQLSCMQGMGDLEYCLQIADKYGISRDTMKKSWCQTNTC